MRALHLADAPLTTSRCAGEVVFPRQGAGIGNDVVDLGDPWAAGAHDRPRFVARVCTERERERLETAADPSTLLWSMFAAKEAAYKVLSKLGHARILAHRAIVTGEALDVVACERVSLRLLVSTGAGWVHAVAYLGDQPAFAEVAPADPDDASGAARRLLCARVALETGCAASDFRVVRDPRPGSFTGYGPPRLLYGAGPVLGDVSLSHDGRFVACAAQLT